MLSTEQKLYEIAKQFNDLNGKGKVKGFGANERGYARIKKLVNGCVLLAHHLNDGKLIVDLMVSPTALLKNEITCNRAINAFEECVGVGIMHEKWEHSIGDAEKWDRYFCVVTNRDLPEILQLVTELKEKISKA